MGPILVKGRHMRNKPRAHVIPGVWFIAALAAMVALDRVAPGMRLIPTPWRYGGVLLITAGIGAGIWAVVLFRESGTTPRPHKTPAALVERGPYRFTRHPMYLGLTAALCGAALLLGSLSPWAVVAAFFVLVARRSALEEERAMEATFGAAYDRYKGRVRRWL